MSSGTSTTLDQWVDAIMASQERLLAADGTGAAVSPNVPSDPLRKVAPMYSVKPVSIKLESISLYETKSHMYIVGCDKAKRRFRVLKLDRTVVNPTSLDMILTEDPTDYDQASKDRLLAGIAAGNKHVGGLQAGPTGYVIFGFVRFMQGYYLILVTQRRKLGSLGGNMIYGIKATEMIQISLFKEEADAESESRKERGEEDASVGAYVTGLWDKLQRQLNPTLTQQEEDKYFGLFQYIDLTKVGAVQCKLCILFVC
jgi:hypothetical protein